MINKISNIIDKIEKTKRENERKNPSLFDKIRNANTLKEMGATNKEIYNYIKENKIPKYAENSDQIYFGPHGLANRLVNDYVLQRKNSGLPISKEKVNKMIDRMIEQIERTDVDLDDDDLKGLVRFYGKKLR